MKQRFNRKKILGIITLGVTGTLIVAAVLALLTGGTIFYVNSVKNENKELLKKTGELESKVSTLEASNNELSGLIAFQKNVMRSSQEVSAEHAKVEVDLREKTAGYKEQLTKRVVVIKEPAMSKEQQQNSQLRIATLWASYCDASKDVKRCTDQHIAPGKKQAQGKAFSSLDWIYAAPIDTITSILEAEEQPIGLNHKAVKEAKHA